MDELAGCLELVVVDDGVDGDVDLGTILMGIAAERTDVVDAVACRHTGAKLLGTDIDGIGTMVDGCDAALQILGRCQQFK